MILLLKNLLFTVLVPGTVAVYVPLWIAGDRAGAAPPLLAVALLLLAVGAAIYAWCVWDFATFGRGTPLIIDAPKRLVVRGLYRVVRNPMYVGVLTVILGWAAYFRAADLALYALIIGAGFHTYIVRVEEPHLRRLFGEDYDRYQAGVRRWMPKLPGPPDRMFFTGMAIAAFVAVFLGFSQTFYLRAATDAAAPLRPLVAAHGVIFTAWMALLVVQTSLVAAGRRDGHRRIGIFGAALAVAVVIAGYLTAVAGGRGGHNPNPNFPDAEAFLIISIGDLAIFAIVTGLALAFRRDAATHKRLMLAGTIGGLVPAALGRLPGQPWSATLILIVLLFAAPIRDLATRRAHWVGWVSVLIFLSLPLRFWLARTDAWRVVARWILE